MGSKLEYFPNKKIIIKINNSPTQESKLILLNPAEKLSTVRQTLKKNYKQFNFLEKFSVNDGESYEFAEIGFEVEEQLTLSDIIDKDILYIKCDIITNIDLNTFINKCKLDYGCTMTPDEIKKADKRAFVIKNCELKEIGAEGCGVDKGEFKSTEERMKITNLFFAADINVDNFVKLGMSIGNSKNKKSNSEISGSYHFKKYAKASLEFTKYLEPTPDFINMVKDAIDSEDPAKKFKQITEEYGQFIPTKIFLGGRAHINEHIMSNGLLAENYKEIAMNTNAGGVFGASMSSTSNYSEGKLNYQKYNCTKLIGGESPNSLENFNEEEWVKSLKDYNNWDCIEYQNPISIFQILSDELRKKIIKSVGKRIHHSDFVEFSYYLEEYGKPKILGFNIPPDISNIIQNKEADCNVFTTVVDMTESKGDFFTCQVLCPPGGKPSLLIHCIQKKFNRRQCKIKIGWMVIGYYVDFNFIISDFNTQLKIFKNENTLGSQVMINTELNFEYNPCVSVPLCLGIPVFTKLDSSNSSLIIGHHFYDAQEENKIGAYTFTYCSKNNIYVELPNFTFYTLISNYCISNTYPFEHPIFGGPYINLNNDVTDSSPKFISLYSKQKTNYGPAFLKQNCKKIKLKSIKCNCNCSFKTKPLDTSKNNIECLSYDLHISDDKFLSRNIL